MRILRQVVRVLSAVAVGLGAAACTERNPVAPGGGEAQLAFLILAPSYVSTLSLQVSGPGIDSTLSFNVTASNGVAAGTLRLPAGAGRHIVGRAFDATGVETHRGDTTVAVVEGTNPAVSFTLKPLVGGQPLTVTIGVNVVALNRQDTTLTSGDTVRFTATAVNWRGVAVPADSVVWASSNPAVATVSASGLVTALAEGTASVVATYEGAVVRRVITTTGTLFSSDGSSLSAFPCHYLSWAPEPTINESDGLPAPSIRYATSSEASFGLSAPYTVPALPLGTRLHGSLDMKMQGTTNDVMVAAFGTSSKTTCDYAAYSGTWDGRFPVPSISYVTSSGLLSIIYSDVAGHSVTVQPAYAISIGSWHHVDFYLTTAADGNYDWTLLIDGQTAAQGRSFEPILTNDKFAVAIGAGGSYSATDVSYDNIQVRIEHVATPVGPSGSGRALLAQSRPSGP